MTRSMRNIGLSIAALWAVIIVVGSTAPKANQVATEFGSVGAAEGPTLASNLRPSATPVQTPSPAPLAPRKSESPEPCVIVRRMRSEKGQTSRHVTIVVPQSKGDREAMERAMRDVETAVAEAERACAEQEPEAEATGLVIQRALDEAMRISALGSDGTR